MITSPRFVSNTSTDIRRTDWKSRDQTDIIAANQLDATARFRTGRVAHALVTGLDLAREIDENRTRVETGPAAPDTDLFHPNPDDSTSAALVPNGAVDDRHGDDRSPPYAFDTVKLGERWELSGRRALGLVRHRLRLDRRHRRQRRRSSGPTTCSAGAAARCSSRGRMAASTPAPARRSIRQPKGCRSSAATVNLAPGADAELRGRHEVGPARGRRLSLNAAIFHTEKTNARTPGINPGDPPTVLRRASARAGRRDRRRRAAHVALGDLRRLLVHVERDPSRRTRRPSSSNDLTLTPRHTFNLWSTFRLPVGDRPVGGGVQFMDAVFRNTLNTTEVPSYSVLSAMASRRPETAPHAALQRQQPHRCAIRRSRGGGHFVPGAGRSVSLTAGFKF